MKLKRIILAGSFLLAIAGVSFFFGNSGEANTLAILPDQAQTTVNKMLDSIDHFKTVKTKIKTEGVHEQSNVTEIEINTVRKFTASATTTYTDGKVINEYQNDQFLVEDPVKKEFTQHKISKENSEKWKEKPKKRVEFNEQGEIQFHPRKNPIFVGTATSNNLIFPQDLALGIMMRAEKVDYLGTEKLLNRNVSVLSIIPMDIQQSSLGNYIKIWVDDQTGIVVKYVSYKDNTLFLSNEMLSLEIDSEISVKSSPDLSAYKNITNQ
ncbi:hypothetical protein [Paenibacillus sp. FJAT-26967]|uniref:hypothetical protein n=1 Tax=Paenibacillus sp. FJAT-26967 TaxID=1729690 RepID=UPI0008380B71|nr:hypothetical protein [Paenibacillus sp. FJAT-26967]